MPRNVDALADAVATVIKAALAPVLARLVAVESRPLVPGRDGRDGAPGPAGANGGDGIPGVNGTDGADGLGLNDFAFDFDGERTHTLSLKRGGVVVRQVSWSVPYVLDRGVYQAGKAYVRGDAVTLGGSLFIAQQPTDARPESAGSGWRLAVKRGNEGKPGRDGADVRDAPVVRVHAGSHG